MGMPASNRTVETEQLATWHEPVLRILYDLAVRQRLIACFVVLGVVAGCVMYVRTPPYFRASAVAVLMSREKPVTGASLELGTMKTENDAAVRGPSGTLMLPPNPNLYIELIYSRAVLEELAARFLTRSAGDVGSEASDEAVARLQKAILVKGTEEGLLTITVTDADRQVSADMANAIVRECEAASKKIERQLVLQQAGYLDGAVLKAEQDVEQTTRDFETFSTKHRLIDPVAEGTESLRMIREAITARESLTARLDGLLVSRTDRDHEVKRLRGEIASIDTRLASSRDGFAGSRHGDGLAALMVEQEGLKQKLRYRRDLLGTLEAQASIFRLRAEQPAGSVAVVRVATPSALPAGPSKKQVFGIPVFCGLALGVLVALLHAQWSRIRKDRVLSESSDRLIAAAVPDRLRRWHRSLLQRERAAV